MISESYPIDTGLPDNGERITDNLLYADRLLFYYLDLSIDYVSGKPINRNVHPVMLFPFYNEFLGVRFSWWITPALRYHIDQQIPDARLGNGRNCPWNSFPPSFDG